MKKTTYVRAGCLQVGANYFLRLQREPGERGDRSLPAYARVKFINITNCPAVVVVQDDLKDLIRCNRADLYIPAR